MKISRLDLYTRVWSTPMSKLARELDISDVGLAKACRRHGIPTPARGYWAKLAAGKAPPKPSLPPSSCETIRLEPSLNRTEIPALPASVVSLEATRVHVVPDTSNLAPTAAATYETLSKTKPTPDGFVSCRSSRAFTCTLSPATLQRACILLDAIERSLPAIGARLVKDKEARRVDLEVNGERLEFSVTEDYRRSETVEQDPEYTWRKIRHHRYHFTGHLRLALQGNYAGRKSWGDGQRSRLEDKLPDFFVGLLAGAHAIVQLRTDREEQRKRWEEESKQRARAAEQQRELRYFAEQLAREAEAWQRYSDVKAYVDHLAALASAEGTLPDVSRKWLRLAAHLARLGDPTRERLDVLKSGVNGYEYEMPFGTRVLR